MSRKDQGQLRSKPQQNVSRSVPPEAQTEQQDPQDDGRIIGVAQGFSGPIPPSGELAHYEEILPGLANRIMALAEQALEAEVEDRRGVRQTADMQVRLEASAVKRGQWFAFIVALSGIAGSLGAVYLGSPTTASIIAGSTLTVLVGSFLGTRRTRSHEDDK